MSRMSWVLLGSVLAVAAVRGEPAVTIDSVQGLSATVSFTGLDAGTTNSLVLAWGGSDAAGETPADWPNRRDLGVVEPEDEQKVVDLPAGWGDSAQHVRFFLRTGVDAPANYAGTPVTWLDGVDNAGTGTHDPTATKWKDKAGTLDMRLTENGSWNTTHNGLDVNGCGAYGESGTTAYRTIDVAFKMRSGRILFASGCSGGKSGDQNPRFVVFDHANGISKGYFDGKQTTLYVPWQVDSTKLRTMTGVYNGSHTVTGIYGDGVQYTGGETFNNTWNSGDSRVMVGERSYLNSKHPWSGEVYAIRLYNRELTSVEIGRNHALDLYRFSADGSTARSAIPAELFTARISVVQLTGEGAVDWYARPGVWRVSLDLMYEGGIFHTETAVYDMRRLRSESAIFIFY